MQDIKNHLNLEFGKLKESSWFFIKIHKIVLVLSYSLLDMFFALSTPNNIRQTQYTVYFFHPWRNAKNYGMIIKVNIDVFMCDASHIKNNTSALYMLKDCTRLICCRFICTNIGPWPKRNRKQNWPFNHDVSWNLLFLSLLMFYILV